MNSPTMTLYRATWIYSGDHRPLEDGCVVCEAGRIVFVGSYQQAMQKFDRAAVVDLGEGAIIPGLVNAHTHLEFSDLVKPLGQRGIKFTDWIRRVVGQRTDRDEASKRAAIRQGIQESFQAGVWAVGEIATQPVCLDAYSAATDSNPPRQKSAGGLWTTLFLEQLGRSETRVEELAAERDEYFSLTETPSTLVSLGISSHAPYSVSWQLHDQIIESAVANNACVAMHVAETEAERQLLDSRTGDFVDLLKDFGAWEPRSFEPRRSTKGFLGRLSQAPRSLVVHGNYLNDDELDLIARNPSMSVVYCPRTHDFFGHAPYALKKMLDRGINVAVGTDSRASNPDLNLFEELKTVAAKHNWLPPERILKLGTVNAAKALGIDDQYGSLTVGKKAALAFVPQPAGARLPASQWLFSPTTAAGPVTLS